ncbi:MAG: glycoside hydrolase family 3 C-terminal domain-containing protein, partial [Lactococcus sp.]|nr:glycoside hydrolase family 3 C-terminal domain-containing protein [Lactococcus sp.]
WGTDSITTQIKHFPGDGPGEGGREAHLFQGKFGVYPGDNLKEHLKVFVDGGLNLSGETEVASSVMTSYSIQTDKDGNPLIGDKYVGTAYNAGIINILRDDNNYDGKLVTDWGVTGDNSEEVGYGEKFMGSGFGMEDATEEERHFEILKAGMDMFGGNNDKEPVLEAYKMWQEDYENGDLEQSAEDRFKESGERIVKSMFDVGLFEDPYLDIDASTESVGSEDKLDAGYKAQLNSVVMLKNKDNTIAPTDNMDEYKDQVVYTPSTMRDPHESSIGDDEPFRGPSMDIETAEKYFGEVVTDTEVKDDEGNVTDYEQPDNLDDVDLVIAGMASPDNGENFSFAGIKEDSETYYPLSLQYRPYTADGDNVRKESIAGNKKDDGSKENRSYYGETSDIANEYDLDAVLNAVELAEQSENDIPVVVAMDAKNPVIMSEFEDKVDAIVVGFGISDNAILDVILGDHEPNGLLPMQFPKDMDTVEKQFEDVPKDMEPYKDNEGNEYDFGYGLNYDGAISDERTEKYVE